MSEWQPIETAPKDGSSILVSFGAMGVWQVLWSDRDGDSCSEYAIWCVDDNSNGPYPRGGR